MAAPGVNPVRIDRVVEFPPFGVPATWFPAVAARGAPRAGWARHPDATVRCIDDWLVARQVARQVEPWA